MEFRRVLFRSPDWKIHGTNRHEMQRQRAEGDEKRPGDIPGDAQHEITVAFRENPGAHGDRFTFVAGRASCGEFNSASSAFSVSLTRLGALRSPSRLLGPN